MQLADIPYDERHRLTALNRLDFLGTSPGLEFDDLSSLAARICDTPIGMVSLIDSENVWVIGRFGIEVSKATRSASFSGHAMFEDGIFEVPDAAKDSRFCDNPWVVNAPNLRFYAGAPLLSPDGFRLGTVCVCDHVPRKLTEKQRSGLIVLSRQGVRQMASHAAVRAMTREGAILAGLHQGARVDVMTGLPNRTQFFESLATAIARGKRHATGIAVVFLDIDRFLLINSSFGLETGDAVLRECASRIKQGVRSTDTVARLAGDEFAVILEDLHTPEEADRVGHKILASLAQPFLVGGQSLRMTVSAGVAYDGSHAHSPASLIGFADELLYVAKTAGGNTLRITAC